MIALAASLAAYAGAALYLARKHPEPQWDWPSIDLDDMDFPPDFLWGTATAAHQVDGGNTNNNWSRWETQTDQRGRPRTHCGDRAGKAADHWNLYPDDFRRMKEDLSVNTYRFSIEWSRVEPEPGRIDPDVVAHYHRLLDCLLALDIQPMMTLHHFSQPLWFEDRGSFEREENLKPLVDFSALCAREYGDKVARWCTVNEPGPFTSMGWGLGVFPPGKKTIGLFSRVLRNLLVCHVQMAQAIKAERPQAQVGLSKNIFQFDPWRRWNLAHWGLARLLDHVYNESILRFFREGVYRMHVPGFTNINEQHPDAPGSLDWVGLNYYSNLLTTPLAKREPPFKTLSRPGQVITDMPYATYPEGFYRALMRIDALGKPIIVTENGIADERDDRREDWIRRYAYAMSRARRDGADIRGFHYWSLMDNFEWAEGYDMRFGLYEVNYETQGRRLRDGSRALGEIIRRFSEGSA